MRVYLEDGVDDPGFTAEEAAERIALALNLAEEHGLRFSHEGWHEWGILVATRESPIWAYEGAWNDAGGCTNILHPLFPEFARGENQFMVSDYYYETSREVGLFAVCHETFHRAHAAAGGNGDPGHETPGLWERCYGLP